MKLWMDNGMILLQYHSQQVLTELKSMMTEKEMRKEVRKEKQFAKTMATITCLFFLTYFPVFLLKAVIPTDYCYTSFYLLTFAILTKPMMFQPMNLYQKGSACLLSNNTC